MGFKPAATISLAQDTVSYDGKQYILEAQGRHDPCVVTRAVSIVESMAALVIMDALCIQMSRSGLANKVNLSKEEKDQARLLFPMRGGKPEL